MTETTKLDSKALDLLATSGWDYQESGEDHVAVRVCPICKNANRKFYIHIGGKKDGVWDCKSCKAAGNLGQLKSLIPHANDSTVSSMQDAAYANSKPALPDMDTLHNNLMDNEKYSSVLDHLLKDRGLKLETIAHFKLGANEGKDKDGNPCLRYVMPYFDKYGELKTFKTRSIPPASKTFGAPKGFKACLFNEAALAPNMEAVVLTEGEMDCMSLYNQGYHSVCGIPGAGNMKADWIDMLDKYKPSVVYLVYDNDQPGQKGAKEMASRIGYERVRNVVIPPFKVDGKDGKDLTEWFSAGYTLDHFNQLLAAAQPFDVEGVTPVQQALDELMYDIETKGTEPSYVSMWPSLNKRLGGYERGDVIGVMAEAKVGKTTMCLNWLHAHALTYKEPVFMFCMEMPVKRMVRKWVSYVTQTEDSPGASGMSVEKVHESLAIARGMEADILFGYSRGNDPEKVFDIIRQVTRRYGVKVVCFDNLQFLIRRVDNVAQEASALSKGFKELAMELGITILLIVQPNRVQEGHIVSARNAYGSSAIEKDVDAMICLHRNRTASVTQKDFNGFLEVDENFEPQMMVRVDLARYAAGGVCTLYTDGGKSTIRELSAEDAPATPAAQPTGGAGVPFEV